VKKTLYKPLGFLFLGLAILGILLPILPGTPFLLLSAWFFARSSKKWHQRLLASELFGPLILNWEQHRCISRRTKLVALVSMAVAGGASVIFGVDSITLKVVGLSLMGVGTATLLSIKTCQCENKMDQSPNID
jgi:uncharacterized membrane protein YbaN (DUF454 family)